MFDVALDSEKTLQEDSKRQQKIKGKPLALLAIDVERLVTARREKPQVLMINSCLQIQG